jgi:ADP-ribosylglycohydrolase
MNTKQKDKIKGLFFGQAIGDALGLGSEFLNKTQVKVFYPDKLTNYSQIIKDSFRKQWKIGEWTDDTDQFLCICDSLIKTKTVDEFAFAKELYNWAQKSQVDIGVTVNRVVSHPNFLQDPFKCSKEIWEESDREAAANGAIMRTSILGAYEFWDYQKVISNTKKIAKVTHWDPRCIGSCIITTLLIANLINKNQILSLRDMIEIGDKYDNRIIYYIEQSTHNNISNLYLDEEGVIGYTLLALSAGLWAYFHAKDFESGLITVINEGGDADTNGAIAGSILGAKFGYDSIPKHLIDGLKDKKLLENKFNQFVELL